MFSILRLLWGQIRSLKPAFLSRNPHFNFNSVHYFYIIGMAIFCSICLFPNGDVPYIDALFFGSGAATQSGLNTVDVNLLTTWQQVAIYFTSTLCTPIAINTFVVFLRLYWFEKRFQHVAKEAKKNRRSIARTFTKTRDTEDPGREERGVQGRDIRVMHETTRTNGLTNDGQLKEDSSEQVDKSGMVDHQDFTRSSNESSEDLKSRSSDSGGEPLRPVVSPHTPQIKFSAQVKRSNGLTDRTLRMPVTRDQEDHIRILQRQRNEEFNDEPSLRIPGPRDADAGISPRAVQESDALSQTFSRASRRGSQDMGLLNREFSPTDQRTDHPVRRNITIQEPAPRTPPAEHLVENGLAVKNAISALKGHGKSNEKSDTHSSSGHSRKKSSTWNNMKKALSIDRAEDEIPYLSWQPTIGRNSVFIDLTEQQREELGGVEYRSLKTLALILTCYNVGFSILGIIGLLPWILESNTYGPIVEQIGQGRAWWGFFTSMSAFTDLGFTLTPDSMVSFNTAVWPLLFMSFLIIIGNTGFPIMLRFIIWATTLWVPGGSGIYEELRFLLDHPRRCFTLLFPSQANWVLFWILVGLNGLDLLFFIVLDLGNAVITDLPVHVRVLDGWFQAVSTRTAGFGVVNLGDLHPAIQVSYLIMMYISVLPIAMSVRRTNVYEEKSLGIYGSGDDEDEGESSYLGAHLRRQLSFDLWFIFAGFFIITIAEGPRIQSGDNGFTMFSVLFEIVSAYGTVGLSLGYPGTNASFSAQFGVVAKLVIIAMQVRGRHRGLPYELDRAILLPSEHLQAKEAKEAEQLLSRRRSSISLSNIDTAISTGTKARGRSRSTKRQGSNFLGNLLHPGPPIPNSHRIDPMYGHNRRNTFTSPEGDNMSMSPRPNSAYGITRAQTAVDFGRPFSDDDHGPMARSTSRVSGRRSFFQPGVNDPGPEDRNEA